ncbi:MAG: hypothetical protein PHW03_03790 [Eubacteriales bacterium]|nr:hypothetical protein [Eubacteriales bacterium]MDD4389904.1 hypothetical protein [Eubacteriales bacterium]
MGKNRRVNAIGRLCILIALMLALSLFITGCKGDKEDEGYSFENYTPSDEFSMTFFKGKNDNSERYEYNVLGLYNEIEGQPLTFELQAYDKSNIKAETETYDGDGMVPYEYKRYIYKFNDKDELWVGTHLYEDGHEFIDYIWTDISYGIKTYRGISVGSSFEDLRLAYPEDLYVLPLDEIGSESGTTALAEVDNQKGKAKSKKSGYDGAYFYQPFEDNDVRDIHFYMREGKVAAIEMFSPFELRNVYSGARSDKNLVNKPSDTDIEFKTEIAATGDHSIPVSWEDLGLGNAENSPQPAQFKYNLLRLDASVPQSSIVNEAACGEALMRYVSLVENGKGLEYVKDTHLQHFEIQCKVEKYRDVIAFVISERYGLYQAGGGRSLTVFYYDADKCNWISKEEYVERCSVNKDKIVDLNNKDLPYENMEAYNIYDVDFYVTAQGKIVVGATYGT